MSVLRRTPALLVLVLLFSVLGGAAALAVQPLEEPSNGLIECPCYPTEPGLRTVQDCFSEVTGLQGGLALDLIQIPNDCYDPCEVLQGPLDQVPALVAPEIPNDGCEPLDFRGTIVVDKVTNPAGAAQAFTFSPSWGPNFMLADADAPMVAGGLATGYYSVAEVNLPAGWSLDSAMCSDGSSPDAIYVSPFETVTCTFYNSEEQVQPPGSSLTIVKMTNPTGGAGFGFTTSANLSGPFTLDGGGSMVFNDLEPGAYTVTEDGLSGDWAFQSVACDALDWSADGQAVTVNLTEGEAAVCTFYNIASLPFTGGSSWLLPLMYAGIAAVLVGAGLVLVPRLRRVNG